MPGLYSKANKDNTDSKQKKTSHHFSPCNQKRKKDTTQSVALSRRIHPLRCLRTPTIILPKPLTTINPIPRPALPPRRRRHLHKIHINRRFLQPPSPLSSRLISGMRHDRTRRVRMHERLDRHRRTTSRRLRGIHAWRRFLFILVYGKGFQRT